MGRKRNNFRKDGNNDTIKGRGIKIVVVGFIRLTFISQAVGFIRPFG